MTFAAGHVNPEHDQRRRVPGNRVELVMVAVPGGVVIWTRGASAEEDLRPQVRRWFRSSGFNELAFEAEPESYGVGVNLRPVAATGDGLPEQLFVFQR